MATGVGFSFDTSFLKNLEKADAKMASLMDKSNQASRSIVSAFQQMNNQGVVPFVQGLEKQKQTLDSVFDAITTKTGKARKDYEGMASSVVDATNAIVSLISKMKSTSQYQLDTKLSGLSAQIKELQEYQERQRQVKVASEQAMNAELDKYRQLIERVRELNSIKAQAKEVKTTSTDKELVKDANKAQREANAELRILKEQQKQIEQKYAVETALIRKQTDAQSFQDKVRQAKDAEKAVEAEIKKEQDAYLKSLSEKIRAQQDYAQRMKELEQARLRQQSANRRASYKLDVVGGTGMNAADQALRYTDRIYSDKGLRSVNNMQKAIQQMQQAQQRLNLNTEQGRQKYEQLDKEIKRAKGDIDRVTGASEDLNKSHKGLLDTSGQLARAFAAMFSVSAIRGYVNKLIEVRGEFELQQRSLQVLLQNKDEANELWDKTVALAVKSPLTTKQLVTSTKQLAAYRVETEKLYETNKMLADVSQGLGVDMNRLILAFGQVKAANFLRGTELRQFSEAGVNMLDELAKRFTALEGRAVSVGEVFERVSKRMVSFKDVEAVFQTITGKGGIFYQMQEKQAETLKGQMLNLRDSYELMLNDIGKQQEGTLKGAISIVKQLVDNWRSFAPVVKAVGTAFTVHFGIKVFKNLGKYIVSAAKGMWQLFTATKATATAATPWGAILTVLSAIVVLTYDWITATDKLQDSMLEVEKNVSENLQESLLLYRELTDTINDSTKSIDERNEAYDELRSKFKDILPNQLLELKYIQGISFEYKRAEDAMFAYYNAKAIQQKKDKVEQKYEEGFSIDEADFVRHLKTYIRESENISAKDKEKLLSSVSTAVSSAIQKLKTGAISGYADGFEAGSKDAYASNLQDEILKGIKDYSGVNLELKSVLGDTATSMVLLGKNINELTESYVDYKEAIDDVVGLAYGTFEQREAAENIDNFNKKIDTVVGYFNQLVGLRQKLADGKIDLTTPESELDERQMQQRNLYLNTLNNIMNGIAKDAPQYSTAIKNIDGQLSEAATKGAYEFRLALANIQNELYKLFAEDAENLKYTRGLFSLGDTIYGSFIDGAKDIDKGVDALYDNFVESLEENAESKLATPLMQSINNAFNKAISDNKLNQKGKDLLAKFLPTPEQSTSDIRDLIKAEVTAFNEAVQQWENATKTGATKLPIVEYLNQFGGTEFKSSMGMYLSSGEDFIELQKKVIPVLKETYSLLGGDIEDLNKKRGRGRTNSLYDERIKVIDDMNKKYQELNKTLDKSTSLQGAFDAYIDAFATAFNGISWIPKNVREMSAEDFVENVLNFPDEDALVEFLDRLAKEPMKTFEKIKVESAKGEYVMDMQVRSQKEEDQKLVDEIERMFSGYELAIELDKLNVPRDFAERLFGVDTFDLTTIREKIGNELNRLKTQDGGQDQIKKMEDFLKKVNDMELKDKERRLKELAEYMRKEQDIRIKLKLEEINKIKDIDESDATEQQKNLLKSNVRRDYAQKIKKAEWDEFTKTPYIVQMFDDLDSVGTKALENLGKKLETLKDDLYSAGLPASELKEILDKINKVEDELNERNPFRGLTDGFKNVFGGLAQARKKYETQLEQQGQADLSYKTFLEAYNVFNETYGEFGGDPEARKLIEVQLRESKTHAEKMQKTTDEVAENYSKAAKSVALLGKRISSAVELTQQLAQSAIDVADSFGAFSEKGSKEVADSAMSILGSVGGLAQAGIKMASGDWLGGITSAVTSIAQLIIGINQTGDAMKQMKIEKELKSVERLQKAYEDLEEAINNVYDLNVLQQKADIANKNIEEQIKAQEKMIALEEDKKKSDQDAIDGYKEEIEELKKQQKELNEQVLEEKGGFGSDANRKSAAEAFVDAWLQAYKETGDGLSGLNDQFDEFYESFVKKQLLLQGTSKYLDSFFSQFDKKINSLTKSAATKEQIANVANEIKETWDGTSSNLDAFLSSLAEALKISETLGSTELAGLQAGIQGMSADQADILAAYWSSVRLYTADTNAKVTELATKLLSDDATSNPMLAQLKNIATSVDANRLATEAIQDLMNSVKTSTNDGMSLKVRMV